MLNDIPKNWTFDKRINLGNLFTACLIAISIFWWAAHLEKRVAILEVSHKSFYQAQIHFKNTQTHRDDRQDGQVDRIEKTMREGFDRLNFKLDKLILDKK